MSCVLSFPNYHELILVTRNLYILTEHPHNIYLIGEKEKTNKVLRTWKMFG